MIATVVKAFRQIRHWSILPWLVLAVGVVASFLLFGVMRRAVEDVARVRFERQANDANGIIEDRIRFYGDVLYGLKALFASRGPVSRRQFHEFVGALDLKNRYPGFDLVNYAAYVRAKDKKRFEEAVRRDTSLNPRGYPHFRIKPAGNRAAYYVMAYLEPFEGFEFAFGVDLSANPQVVNPKAVEAAQEAARDSGKLTASGRPIRVKAANREYTGLAMRLPVYRRGMPVDTVEQRRSAYLGSVGAGFNVENIMRGILDENVARYMRFKVYGAEHVVDTASESSNQEWLLFDSRQVKANPLSPFAVDDQDSFFSVVLPIDVGGRTWEVHFSAPQKAMIDPLNRGFPLVVLIGGLLSSVLLFAVMHSLSSSRTRAVKIADQITKDLRETEERFRLISENASDLITVINPRGRRVYVNPAFGKLLGNPEALIGSDAFGEVHPEDKAHVRKTFFDTLEDGRNRRAEFRFLLPSGEVRYIESHRSAVLDPEGRVTLVVAVARDVTERKRADEELHNYAERLRVTSRRLVEIQETERRLIASELHDRVGQNLTGLGLNLSIVASALQDVDKPELAARLEDSNLLLRNTVDAIRNVMAELRPHTLDEYGLPAALRSLAAGFSKRTGIQVAFDGDPARTGLPKTVDLAMFRIVQEALNNIAKHSNANRVEIAISRRNGHATLSVRDNGVGFDPENVESSEGSGWGLLIMRERAESVGARFSLKAEPNAGVNVLVEYNSGTGA
jgi:PAS domain S-box-containing protein